MNYLDPEKFDALFADIAANRDEIAQGLHLISQGFVSTLAGPNPARRFPHHWLEDAAQEATLMAIANMDRFDPARRANAFSFFTKMIARRVFRELRIERRLSQGMSKYVNERIAARVTGARGNLGGRHERE